MRELEVGVEERKIPVYEISLEEADGYLFTDQEVLRRELVPRRLYRKSYAYSAFPPRLLEMVLKTGTFHRQDRPRRDYIHCCIIDPPGCKEKGIRDNGDMDLIDYVDSAKEISRSPFGTFAVYELSQLEERDKLLGHPFYKFRYPDRKREALVAVVKVFFYRPKSGYPRSYVPL